MIVNDESAGGSHGLF